MYEGESERGLLGAAVNEVISSEGVVNLPARAKPRLFSQIKP